MAIIVKFDPVSSITVGPDSIVTSDGTIIDPEPYEAVNVHLDDGRVVQVVKPITKTKIRAALARLDTGPASVGIISRGDVV